MDQRFRWDERLHRQRDFSRVIREGRRHSQAGLIFWVNRVPGADYPPRMGLAIPRAFGNAVARNRLKRLLREIFRLHKHALPRGVDMVFGARRMTITLNYKTLEPLVLDLWKKAGLSTLAFT